jgi:hypothetical protein
LAIAVKRSRVERRLLFEGRVVDWRVRSGRTLVSKVACIEVGEEVERTLVFRERPLIWYRERPAPWTTGSPGSVTGFRWRVVTPGWRIKSLCDFGMPCPSSMTVRVL